MNKHILEEKGNDDNKLMSRDSESFQLPWKERKKFNYIELSPN